MPEFLYIGVWSFFDRNNPDWDEFCATTKAFDTKDAALHELFNATWETVAGLPDDWDPYWANPSEDINAFLNDFYKKVDDGLMKSDDDWYSRYETDVGSKHFAFQIQKTWVHLVNENN